MSIQGKVASRVRKSMKRFSTPRESWPRGPWTDEPDREQFKTRAGFTALAVRGPMGAWCGYVALPPSHPAYKKRYDALDVEVHGGLTYANECAGEICHVPEPGEPDDVIWYGFDCSHAGDVMPALLAGDIKHDFASRDVYRDLAYVKNECENLAAQFRKMADEVRA